MSQSAGERLRALEQLRDELLSGGRSAELEALDQLIAVSRATQSAPSQDAVAAAPSSSATAGARPVAGGKQPKTYLKLKKKYYTPAEVARRVGVSRQTIVKWIERGELEAELTPGGHHRIPASVFHREGRGDAVQLIPVDED
ncbi:MAG: Helix-turn-helix domain [Thermoleophilia bacterium]|nr:Helix-turn-helix domain [Thermoleophilia bacterium]MCZ4495837.1 Helix-turn-helix domain [Thermoleophilia bacterium]